MLEANDRGPDRIVEALQQLQRTNDRLVRELRRQTVAAERARLDLESVHSSPSFRLLKLVFGARDAKRRRFARSLLQFRRTWKHLGPWDAFRRCWLRLRLKAARCEPLPPPLPRRDFHALYEEWIVNREPDDEALEQQRQTRLVREPLISLVVPAFRTPLSFLVALLESVQAQTYANWELCIADGGSDDPLLRSVLESHCRRDDRIRIRFLETNLGIGGNTNAALELATGDYVGFLDHDDTLAPFALFEVARALNDWPDADILYSDEDFIDESGLRRFEPTFKPAWSPDVLRGHNYVCHFAVYRRELLHRLGGVRGEFDGAQDHDLILRASECARRIVHIPQVLYHWRRHPGSTAYHIDVKPGAGAAARRAVSEHLERLRIAGGVETNPDGITCAVRLANPHRPLVSVLIPNRDSRHVLETCLTSVAAADYQNLEILIIENNSTDAATFQYYDAAAERDRRIRLLNWPGPFNDAAMHNWAVPQARGEVLLLLNNDVEARHTDWIERMLEHAVRDEVGAVGAKLYYPDGRIQHGGVVVGIGGVADHAHRGDPEHFPGDHQRLVVPQNLSASTAACLMLRKAVYREVDGFDERLAVTFNDVDLCLRIRQLDKLIVWTPFARLWHHESLTRGSDDTPERIVRALGEARMFQEKWADFLAEGDPYYNPNLSIYGTVYAPDPHTGRQLRARSSVPFASREIEESQHAA